MAKLRTYIVKKAEFFGLIPYMEKVRATSRKAAIQKWIRSKERIKNPIEREIMKERPALEPVFFGKRYSAELLERKKK